MNLFFRKCLIWRKPVFSFSIAIILFFSNCIRPPHPGFTKAPSGVFYKILVLGEGKFPAKDNDFVTISYSISAIKDSIQEGEGDTILQLNSNELKTLFKGISMVAVFNCVKILNEGDSALFIIDNNGKEIEFSMKAKKIQSPYEYAEEQKYISWKNDGEMNELKHLKEFLKKKKIDEGNLVDGIYFLPLKKGRGKIVEIGNTVVVHYKGSFLDSTIFDSTYEKKEPFEFKFGDDDQVIPGLELAICQMRKGEKAKLIIPSQLAFGESGSSTGIVPPFTTVEYELELINLK